MGCDFRDASFVVTDSFHGTVFSVIFGKPFRSVVNETRGGARFADLLEKYHSGTLAEWRQKSFNFYGKRSAPWTEKQSPYKINKLWISNLLYQ